MKWFIKSKTRTNSENTRNSINWAQQRDITYSPRKIFETGSREKWRINNIYDFGSNVGEFTQEEDMSWDILHVTIRGCTVILVELYEPNSCRDCCSTGGGGCHTGFRSALYIK